MRVQWNIFDLGFAIYNTLLESLFSSFLFFTESYDVFVRKVVWHRGERGERTDPARGDSETPGHGGDVDEKTGIPREKN